MVYPRPGQHFHMQFNPLNPAAVGAGSIQTVDMLCETDRKGLICQLASMAMTIILLVTLTSLNADCYYVSCCVSSMAHIDFNCTLNYCMKI